MDALPVSRRATPRAEASLEEIQTAGRDWSDSFGGQPAAITHAVKANSMLEKELSRILGADIQVTRGTQGKPPSFEVRRRDSYWDGAPGSLEKVTAFLKASGSRVTFTFAEPSYITGATGRIPNSLSGGRGIRGADGLELGTFRVNHPTPSENREPASADLQKPIY